VGDIAFSAAFHSFIDRSDGVIEPTVKTGDRSTRVLRWTDRVATVTEVDALYTLDWGTRSGNLHNTDVHAIEKVIAMTVGPGVRRAMGLPPEGFLPDILTLAPGFSYESMGRGMELSWYENGVRHGVVADAERTVETFPTYRSQSLRHPLDAIIASFVGEGPGIFTEEAPGAPRPFALPDRSHAWILKYIDGYWPTTQCVFYDNQDTGMRISVSEGGYRVDSRSEREYTFKNFDLWTPSMDVLQVWAMWAARSAWSPLSRQRRSLQVPGAPDLAAGYTIEAVPAPSRYEGALQSVKDDAVLAIMGAGRFRSGELATLSHLLTVGIDTLEISILDPEGRPALASDSALD
jgi:hypothetical protein